MDDRAGDHRGSVPSPFVTSGYRSSILVTAPPVACSMRRARAGDGARYPQIICDIYDGLIPASVATDLMGRLFVFENSLIGCMAVD